MEKMNETINNVVENAEAMVNDESLKELGIGVVLGIGGTIIFVKVLPKVKALGGKVLNKIKKEPKHAEIIDEVEEFVEETVE